MEKIRIAHISDLHFSNICLSPTQFFSKRWIGNFNLLLRRKAEFDKASLNALPDLFAKHRIDLVLITGDLSTTGQKKEFAQATEFIQSLKSQVRKVIAIPGNHDHYTMRGWKSKLFFDYFPDPQLKKEGVSVIPLTNSWVLVALDSAVATSLNSSQGLFSEELESNLTSALSSISPDRHVLLMNHFPLFAHQPPTKTMQRSSQLRELLKKFPNVKLYLHGHTHSHCIANLRANGLPIIVDSGSTAHRLRGTWNLLELSDAMVNIQAFRNMAEPFTSHSWSLRDG
jgi:3',5'-cyclic AMP phosphodiesterase CpdA